MTLKEFHFYKYRGWHGFVSNLSILNFGSDCLAVTTPHFQSQKIFIMLNNQNTLEEVIQEFFKERNTKDVEKKVRKIIMALLVSKDMDGYSDIEITFFVDLLFDFIDLTRALQPVKSIAA